MRIAHDNYSVGWYWAYYASFVLPMLAFCVYGLIRRDFVAEFIAFLGLLMFLLWRISRDMSRLSLYKSLFRKVVEHERKPGA